MIFSTISKSLFQSRFRFCNTHTYPQIREDPPQERKKGKTGPLQTFQPTVDHSKSSVLRACITLTWPTQRPIKKCRDSNFVIHLQFLILFAFFGLSRVLLAPPSDPHCQTGPEQNFDAQLSLHASARKPCLKGAAADLLCTSAVGAAVGRAVREKPVRPHAITPISSPVRAPATGS